MGGERRDGKGKGRGEGKGPKELVDTPMFQILENALISLVADCFLSHFWCDNRPIL